MQIIIDTKKDSHEEIRKTIDFLKRLIEAPEIQDSEVPNVQPGLFNMFNEDSSKNPENEDDKCDEGKINIETY